MPLYHELNSSDCLPVILYPESDIPYSSLLLRNPCEMNFPLLMKIPLSKNRRDTSHADPFLVLTYWELLCFISSIFLISCHKECSYSTNHHKKEVVWYVTLVTCLWSVIITSSIITCSLSILICKCKG